MLTQHSNPILLTPLYSPPLALPLLGKSMSPLCAGSSALASITLSVDAIWPTDHQHLLRMQLIKIVYADHVHVADFQ